MQTLLEVSRSALNVFLNLTMDFDLIHCGGDVSSLSETHGRGELGDLSSRIDLCVCQPAARVLFPFPSYLVFRTVSNWDTFQRMRSRFFCLKVFNSYLLKCCFPHGHALDGHPRIHPLPQQGPAPLLELREHHALNSDGQGSPVQETGSC